MWPNPQETKAPKIHLCNHEVTPGIRVNLTQMISFKRQPDKMVKHTQTIRSFELNCLSVFNHFMELAL